MTLSHISNLSEKHFATTMGHYKQSLNKEVIDIPGTTKNILNAHCNSKN